ncbi:hypothetical protein AFLA_011926 [Aspergillus flavus NRRL3357]|nr:hypothetical protein AFLA_011926 [Aspergillus flavus NRRL3357]
MAGPSVYHRKKTQLPISRTKQCLYRNILHRYGAPADRESSKHTVALERWGNCMETVEGSTLGGARSNAWCIILLDIVYCGMQGTN